MTFLISEPDFDPPDVDDCRSVPVSKPFPKASAEMENILYMVESWSQHDEFFLKSKDFVMPQCIAVK